MEKVERVMGIEPTYQAWEARVLPLNYTREKLRRSSILALGVEMSNFPQR